MRSRLVGINHVALEVGSVEDAVAFYTSVFAVREVEYEPGMAFLDMGDQFVALSEGRSGPRDAARHFGLVVDDRELARAALEAAGTPIEAGRGLNFRDQWGNLVQVVDYRDIQFTKAPAVLGALGLGGIEKRPAALAELRGKGLTNS